MTVIKSIGKVLNELDKLGFATEFASKPMLEIVLNKVWHNSWGYDMLHSLATDVD